MVAVKSVKEQANKLNRLNTQMELNQNIKLSRKQSFTKESNPSTKHIDLENIDLADPKPTEKEWILVCSRCEYQDMAKLLSKSPELAQKKDPFTVGHTCI